MGFGRKFDRNASAKLKQKKPKMNKEILVANRAMQYGSACLDALNEPKRRQHISNCIEVCANIVATYVLLEWFNISHVQMNEIRDRTETLFENIKKTKDIKHPKYYELTYDILIRNEIWAPDDTWCKSLDYPEYRRNKINLDEYVAKITAGNGKLSYDDCIEATVRIFCLDLGMEIYNNNELLYLCAAADVLGWGKYRAMFFVFLYRTMIRSTPADIWDMYNTIVGKHKLRDNIRDIVKNAEYYWKHSLQYAA